MRLFWLFLLPTVGPKLNLVLKFEMGIFLITQTQCWHLGKRFGVLALDLVYLNEILRLLKRLKLLSRVFL